MSWLFSRALVEEYSPANSLDGEQFAQLNVMPTQHKFWRNDKTMEFSDLFRFGLTLRLLTEDHGVELLTSFRADFHAKTYPLLEKAQVSLESEADFGLSKPGSLAKWNQATSSWKTAQPSLFADSESSSVQWPRWGSMRNGVCYQEKTVGPFICESEFGFSLPTPGKNEGKGSSAKRYLNSPHFRGAKTSEGLRICEADPIYLNPSFADLIMMFPSGWTDLQPLGMHKFREWRQQHGKYLVNETTNSTKDHQNA